MSRQTVGLIVCVILTAPWLFSCSAKWAQVGRLIDQKGVPIVGAEVFIATPARHLSIIDGKSAIPDTVSMLTVDDGRFWVRNEGVPFAVFVIDERGYAEAAGEALNRNPDLVLQPWSRVEGRVVLEDVPVAKDSVVMVVDRRVGAAEMHYRQSTRSSDTGAFTVERVPPGEADVSRLVEFRRGYTQRGVYDHGVTLTTRPGQTQAVALGGRGAQVTGRFVVPGEPDFDFSSQFIFGYMRRVQPNKTHNATVALDVHADGSFTAQDVPPGAYELRLEVSELKTNPPWGTGRLLMSVDRNVTIPPNTPKTGHNLGPYELAAATHGH